MKDRIIAIEGRDGAFGAYITRPKVLPAPAVVVLHEVFGVTPISARPATNSPNKASLLLRPTVLGQEPGDDLSGIPSLWRHGLRLYQAYERIGASDFKDAADFVAELPECAGKVGVLGFCLGGLMTFLTVARYGVDAAVAYHGGDREVSGRGRRPPRSAADAFGRGGRVHFQGCSS